MRRARIDGHFDRFEDRVFCLHSIHVTDRVIDNQALWVRTRVLQHGRGDGGKLARKSLSDASSYSFPNPLTVPLPLAGLSNSLGNVDAVVLLASS
jgi:hypothetical protein